MCDDGGGIVLDELLFVVVLYVISKIGSFDDFEYVVSMGFCGEVLVLVLLVVCFVLILCVCGVEVVFCIEVDGGKL